MEVSNFWVSLIFSEIMDYHLLKTCKFPLCPLVCDKQIPPIRTREIAWRALIAFVVSPGVVLSLPARLTFLRVQRTGTILRAASVMTSFVVDFASI